MSGFERTIVLVRHGEFSMSSLGLTPLGRKQAARVARRLRAFPLATIRSSTMKRAFETALIIAKYHRGRSVVRTHLLRECLPTVPRNRRKNLPGFTAEMIRRGKERADRAYGQHFRRPGLRDRVELLVSHGNVIRYFVGRILGLGTHGWYQLGTAHCGMTVIRITGDGRRVVDMYNDTGHLPASMRTTGARTVL